MNKATHKLIFAFIILWITLLSAGCDQNIPDGRLTDVRRMSDTDFRAAGLKLNEINRDSLSEFNRHYYDLMDIRIKDKSYLTPESDSTILNIVEFFKGKQVPEIYTEALYYGGRIYYNMGDLPEALKYFENAALIYPENRENDRLFSNIHFQIAFTLNSLRMYKEAIPHLRISLEKDRFNRDTVFILTTLQTIGSNYLHDNRPDSAEVNFLEARRLARMSGDTVNALVQDMYLSKIYNDRNNIDSALKLIRPVLQTILEDSTKAIRNVVLAYSLGCYKNAGIKDTVALYAKELIHCKLSRNKIIGYNYLFEPDMIGYIEPDSLIPYVKNMYNLVEEYLDRNEGEMAIAQNSLYNYRFHEQKRIEAEKANNKLIVFLIVAVGFILVLIIVILIMRIRTNGRKMMLMQSYDLIADLRLKQRTLDMESGATPDSQDSHSVRSDMGSRELPIAKNIDQLREMIKREYQALQANAKSYKEVSEAIIRSPGYVEAADLLKNGKSIGETSDIWDELARAVEESYPDFKIKFQTLLGGRMKTREYHMALLIKCGFKPTDLAVLMARSKGTLSNQRNELCRRMTGEDGSAQLADMIISLL